jgi:hypothetical protein
VLDGRNLRLWNWHNSCSRLNTGRRLNRWLNSGLSGKSSSRSHLVNNLVYRIDSLPDFLGIDLRHCLAVAGAWFASRLATCSWSDL